MLEEKSSKYQEIITFSDKQYKKRNTINNVNTTKAKRRKREKTDEEDGLKIDAIENRVNNPLTGRSIVIPATNTKAVEIMPKKEETIESNREEISSTVKGRGRPKKVAEQLELPEETFVQKRKRGRPKKVKEQVEETTMLEQEMSQTVDNEEPVNLFAMPNEKEDDDVREEPINLFDISEEPQEECQSIEPEKSRYQNINEEQSHEIKKTNYYNNYNNFEGLLSKEKKLVAFVGTTKNGTSFIVNNLAILFSTMGINTAILDTTKNRNSYYIFTKNEEELRKKTYNSILNLAQGRAEGIQVNKNLTVYTALPGEKQSSFDIGNALKTLTNNYSLVLIDCDFYTEPEYFAASQEIYLVQSMDVLTIQPLTSFLRDLKNQGVLSQEKLKVVINKAAKVRGLSERVLIGGMAFYNDPSMSFMTELFKKETVMYKVIPFDINVYEAYLETLVTCELSTNKYPKAFMTSLKELANMVYPLLNKQSYKPKQINYDNINRFSNNMNDTLERMKRNY